MKKPNKKGQTIFSNLGALGIGVATLAIILVVTFLIMVNVKEQIAADAITTTPGMADANGSLAWNATKTMQENTYSLVGWVGLVIIVAIGVIILGLVRQIRQ